MIFQFRKLFYFKQSRFLFFVSGVIFLTACDFNLNPQERQAIKVVTDLVIQLKQNNDTGESLDKDQGSPEPEIGASAQNTLRYLRARHQQGFEIRFTSGSRTAIDENKQVVTVIASEAGKGDLRSQQGSYSINCYFEKRNEAWVLTGIRVDY